MELELAKQLTEMLQEEDYDATLREDYVARGCFRRTTAGIVCDGIGNLLAMVISRADELVDAEGEPLFDVPTKIQIDSMGLQTIVY
jgi:hypothetical protein